MYNASMVVCGTIDLEARDDTETWCASVLPLGVTGYGVTRQAACTELAASLEELAAEVVPSRSPFEVSVVDDGEHTLLVSASDTTRLIALLLRDQRTSYGMSLADVAEEAGARSRNAYAQYEQGKVMPTLSKLQDMLDIVAPELVLAILPRTARVLPREEEMEPELDEMIRNPSPVNVAAWTAVSRAKEAKERETGRARRTARAASARPTGKRKAVSRA